MKANLFIIILMLLSCNHLQKSNQPSNEQPVGEIIVKLSPHVELESKFLFSFIDSFLVRIQGPDIKSNNLDPEKLIYTLFIYQNDFFTRVKISYLFPNQNSIYLISYGTGYFEYEGYIFVVYTGLSSISKPDSALETEVLGRFGVSNIVDDLFIGSTITWEADILRDTILIRGGTMNPFTPPPGDTTILYKYIRSIRSFDWRNYEKAVEAKNPTQ